MRTYPASLQAALQQPAVELTQLLAVYGPTSTYLWSRAPLTWNGSAWEPRLGSIGALTEGGIDRAEFATRQTQAEIANADGKYSGLDLRNARATIYEVVPTLTPAVRAIPMRVSHVEITKDFQLVLNLEDPFSVARARNVPPDGLLMTRERFPGIADGSPVLGKPVPNIYGRLFTRCWLVNQTASGAEFVACVGTATIPGSVYQLFGDPAQFQVVGCAQVYYQHTHGIPLTMVRLKPVGAAFSDGVEVPLYADLQSQYGGNVTPAEVLFDLLTNSIWGAHVETGDLSVPHIHSAHVYWRTHSYFLDFQILEQRTLEEWVRIWQADAAAYLVLTDSGLGMVPITSVAPVGSLAAFVAGEGDAIGLGAPEFALAETPLSREESALSTVFRDRVRDFDQPQSHYTFVTSPGLDVGQRDETLVMVGRPSMVARRTQLWARMAALGRRSYTVQVGPYAAGYEVGDPVTLTYSIHGIQDRTTRIVAITRRPPRYDVTLRDWSNSAAFYDPSSVPNDAAPGAPFYLFVPFDPAGNGVVPFYAGPTSGYTWVVSHGMHTTPELVRFETRQILQPFWDQYVTGSFVSANDSEFAWHMTLSGTPIVDSLSEILGFRGWSVIRFAS